jgi:hypothetical protein
VLTIFVSSQYYFRLKLLVFVLLVVYYCSRQYHFTIHIIYRTIIEGRRGVKGRGSENRHGSGNLDGREVRGSANRGLSREDGEGDLRLTELFLGLNVLVNSSIVILVRATAGPKY